MVIQGRCHPGSTRAPPPFHFFRSRRPLSPYFLHNREFRCRIMSRSRQTPYKAISGKRTLQRLRREAGYRSAKELPRRSASPAQPTRATSAPETAPAAASRCQRHGRSRTSWAAPSTSSSAARTSMRSSPRESSPATKPSAPRAAPSSTATSPTWSSASALPAPRAGGERHDQG